MNGWVGLTACLDAVQTEEMRNAYKILLENPEWKTPLARPRHRYLREIVSEGVDCSRYVPVAGFVNMNRQIKRFSRRHSVCSTSYLKFHISILLIRYILMASRSVVKLF
jgi:hypothetical protein